jgi:hypothetical protein
VVKKSNYESKPHRYQLRRLTVGVRSGWIGDCSGWLYHQPTKIEQMMEHLVAFVEKIDAKQTKTDASIKEVIADMRDWRKEMKAC